MSEPDDLFTLRNHFWLGSYQLAIAEGSGLSRLPENLRIERDEFIYRSYIALGQYSVVLGEVRFCTSPQRREMEGIRGYSLSLKARCPYPFLDINDLWMIRSEPLRATMRVMLRVIILVSQMSTVPTASRPEIRCSFCNAFPSRQYNRSRKFLLSLPRTHCRRLFDETEP